MDLQREALDLLNKGVFICTYRNARVYDELCKPAFFNEVDKALSPFGRCVKQSYGLYYAAFRQNLIQTDKNILREHIKEQRDLVRPIVNALEAIMYIEGRDVVIQVGDEIAMGSLLQNVEQHAAGEDKLKKLMGHDPFKRKASRTNADRISNLLRTLEEHGYLKCMDSQNERYRVLGKIDYFYALLKDLQEREDIHVADEDDIAANLSGGELV